MANIRKRGENAYEIRVSCGYDIKGRQKFQQMTWRPEPGMSQKQIDKEVNRQAILFEESCKDGQTATVMKFETFAEQWIDEYAKLNLRYNTYEQTLKLRTRIYPALGHLKLSKVTTRDVQRFINDLFENGRSLVTNKPLSRKTVVHHLSFISNVFNYAIKMGLVKDNPCTNVTVPKQAKKEKEIYTIGEIEQIFQKLETEPLKHRLFIMLAVYSGCRRGEILGFEWKDLDFDENLIRVRRTSNYSPSRGMYTDTTKTVKSQRTLVFPALIMDLLKEHKAQQDYERMMTGNKWIDTDRLFVQWNGTPIFSNTPYTWFKRFCERNGFRFCDIHSMRHFHASVLINAGVDVVSVSAGLGHSVVTTTLNQYSHHFQEARARNCEAITNVLNFGANKRANCSTDCSTDGMKRQNPQYPTAQAV